MRIAEPDDVDDVPVDTIRSVLADHPVRLGILFGSRVRDRSHDRSDIDVAIEFDGLRPGDAAYRETLLQLGVDLCTALGSDDIDVLDIRSSDPALARSILDHGVLVVGSPQRADTLRARIADESSTDAKSPRERFERALSRVNDHLA